MDQSTPSSWIQLGAVGVLAVLVLMELRQIRPVLAGVREVLAALLERERIRAERKREPSEPPPSLKPSSVPRHESWEEPSTDLHSIIERQRRDRVKTPAHGVRLPRPGSHHDKDE